jgi:hypothetical protein
VSRDLHGTRIVTDDRVRYGEEPGEGTVKAHSYEEDAVLVQWDGHSQPEWEDPSNLLIVGNWRGRA